MITQCLLFYYHTLLSTETASKINTKRVGLQYQYLKSIWFKSILRYYPETMAIKSMFKQLIICDNKKQLKMMIKPFIALMISLLLLQPCFTITKYDFNVCRIKFCSEKQAACISDEDYCMDSFAKTRACFQGCTSADQLETYNKCWTSCKQTAALSSNGLYSAVGGCYESLCYLFSELAIKFMGVLLLSLLFLA